ncbi:Z1 domain-containing protein [Streptomyces sp. NPDC046900]|uniref:Z1 domain-containing protein n=1 Tax=Streptomyces sp. NPDC046900 TaxID=3155473 RepID=UPI0033DEF07D
MTDPILQIHAQALSGMGPNPRSFRTLAQLIAEDIPGGDLSEDAFRERITEDAACGGPLAALWGKALNTWDREQAPNWSAGTVARTRERRLAVYDRLGFGPELRAALDTAAPVAVTPPATVIAREHVPWYTGERATARSFYWPAYERKLQQKKWHPEAIADLDEASRAVVERLTDPEQPARRQAKGLAVGYVQSGKTANFTGVVAKALDAGYRLVIVLGGTLNLLRAQTQRRLDMELIGQENILRGADLSDLDSLVGIDYVEDEDWPKFVQHGGRPSAQRAFDIERLTTRDKDYKSLEQGIRALEFEKRDPTKPLYDPVNLHHAAARVMVVKKNKAVLTKLVSDLKKIHGILGEIPALIIDDESDQASVNTSDPSKWAKGATERSTINGLISKLLELLPRAQYVGYTATPFANVFVDPGDAQDIFPSDFLISLEAPAGYMGVRDFHDLDSPLPDSERTPANSQEKAHVRSITEKTGDLLQEAMDSFLLAGALKLFRADRGVDAEPFRHHTMLVHQSVRTDDHAELALRINSMWHQAGYASTQGHSRLADLWERDFRKVSAARAADLPNPDSYDELRPYISRARQRISSGGNPVVIVNGDTDRYFEQLDLDFDRTPHVWKILIGGTKLSRGFTVEGLTITYYRRTARQADTLMQMGRWFGFRPGYRDLVRLYIGREEPLTRTRTVDLYEAFEAICRDEELFRQELKQYAELIDGKPQVIPDEVPPLVAQHLPWVKPSARNKMFNAELVEIRSPGRPIELLSYPQEPAALARNVDRWAPVLKTFPTESTAIPSLTARGGVATRPFTAQISRIKHAELLAVLSRLEWAGERLFVPHLNYLAQLDGRLALVTDWLLIASQLTEGNRVEASVAGSAPLSLSRRTRQRGTPAFGRIAGVNHQRAAGALIAAAAAPGPDSMVGPDTGVALIYPIVEGEIEEDVRSAVSNGKADSKKVVMAFTLYPPKSAIDSSRRLVRFRAKDSRHPDQAIIPAPGA